MEIDESYFGGKRKGKRGRGASGKVPVFGILERDGLVHVEAVPNVRAETLLGMTVRKVRRGKHRLHGQVQGLRFPYVLADTGTSRWITAKGSMPAAKSASTAWKASGALPRSALSGTLVFQGPGFLIA